MKLNIKKLQQGNQITFNKNLNYVEPFSSSPYNFLNIPKKSNFDAMSILSKGNIGDYDPTLVDEMINRFEGFRDKPYKNKKDPNDKITIGHGLTDSKYVSKGFITREDSLKAVKEHINKEVIPHLSDKPYWNNLNLNQRSALIDYVYNIGSGNFNTKSPSLQKALTEGNWEEAAKQMDFDYDDKANPGAKVRRDYERQLFLKQ